LDVTPFYFLGWPIDGIITRIQTNHKRTGGCEGKPYVLYQKSS
jgi:hypothetical protein